MNVFLSYQISKKTPMYGGKKGFISKKQNSIENGDSANTSIWKFPNHLGTHIDFPYHFYKNGQTSSDFCFENWVFEKEKIQLINIELPKNKLLIKPEYITNKKINTEVEVILLKTGFSKFRGQEKYWKHNPGLDPSIADWIKNNFKKIKIIGIDSISISSYQYREVGRKVHKTLLNPKKPILPIEDMNLSKINKATIFEKLFIIPLRVDKSDGLPCTIMAEIHE